MKYVIRKNPMAVDTPWLVEIGGSIYWGSFKYLQQMGGKLVSFPSVAKAEEFLEKNKGDGGMCYEDSFICKMIISTDSISIEMLD